MHRRALGAQEWLVYRMGSMDFLKSMGFLCSLKPSSVIHLESAHSDFRKFAQRSFCITQINLGSLDTRVLLIPHVSYGVKPVKGGDARAYG